jgi:hypothetical protein
MTDVKTGGGTKFAFRIDRPRKGAGYALMFFNVNFGLTVEGQFVGLITAKDFSLMKSRDGEYYIKGPSKPRVKNNTLQEKDGKRIYDDVFLFYAEEGAGQDGGFGTTKAAFALRKRMIEDTVKVYEELPADSTPSGRGGASKGDYASNTGDTAGDIFGQDGSDDFPF